MTEPTFTRNSIAYKSDGTQVGVNVPRFESTGLTIEEGTTNLLTANQAGLTTDTTGFNPVNSSVISRDTTAANRRYGSGALKAVTGNATTDEGLTTANTGVSPSNNYSASVDLCGSGTVVLFLTEFNGGAWVGDSTSSVITLTSTPTRYSVSRLFGASGNNAVIQVRTNTKQTATIYASGSLIENKPYATSWIDGGTTRQPESLTIPTSGVLTASQGTIEMDVNVAGNLHASIGNKNLITIGSGYSHGYWMMKEGGNWKVYVWSDGGTSYGASIADNLSVGIHRFALRWSPTRVSLFIDGIESAYLTSFTAPTSLADCYAGSSAAEFWCDAQISDLMLSQVARPDWQLQARGQP